MSFYKKKPTNHATDKVHIIHNEQSGSIFTCYLANNVKYDSKSFNIKMGLFLFDQIVKYVNLSAFIFSLLVLLKIVLILYVFFKKYSYLLLDSTENRRVLTS